MPDIIKNDRRAVAGWCMYDWANSAFTTLVVTFIYATYFTSAFAADTNLGTALWSRGVGASAVLIALLSPILGAIADRGGRRKQFLVAATLTMSVSTAALAFITPEFPRAALIALTVFVVANVAFEIGIVFYNSFLPTLATPDRIGRVSGYGWGLGYVGGLACLVVALVAFVGFAPEPGLLGLSTENGFHARATNLLVAGWVLVFALPMFFWVHEPAGEREAIGVRQAFADLAGALRNVRQYREVAIFLLARLVYNDGLVTIFAFGGIYAMGTFGFTLTDVMIFGIVINSTAGAGALVFGMMDDRWGGKKTVMVSLVALIVAVGIAFWAPSRPWLWAAAVAIGIFAGPNQSASRSLMARFVPEKHLSEFFGFFALSGKATAFLGPLLFGVATQTFATQRAGVATVLVFFAVGGAILFAVDETKGIAAARAD